ncbi:MAG: hypothetical protein ACYDGY_05860, partial [Acidimicrobiales bacterium]
MQLRNFQAAAVQQADAPSWLASSRDQALSKLAAMEKPSESEENWRYSIIDALDLDDLAPAFTYGLAQPGQPHEHISQDVRDLRGFMPGTTGMAEALDSSIEHARDLASRVRG